MAANEDQLNINYPLLIDGGLSNVLESQGCDLNNKLWTAQMLQSDPNALIATHLAYIRAGAQCIATASYQASTKGLVEAGYSTVAAEKLLVRSVELVEIAIQKALKAGEIKRRPLIAASIGPYGAYLADGSEYRGNYGITDKALEEFHSQNIHLLDKTNADILAFETVPSLQEAKVLAEILLKVEKPAWISFSCKDEKHVNDGSAIKDCAAIFKDHPKVFAVGANCTHPKYISEIIKEIKSSSIEKKIIVYPNSGEAYNAVTKSWIGLSEPTNYVEMTKEWLDIGADIVGGCCRIGPDHIQKISVMLKE